MNPYMFSSNSMNQIQELSRVGQVPESIKNISSVVDRLRKSLGIPEPVVDRLRKSLGIPEPVINIRDIDLGINQIRELSRVGQVPESIKNVSSVGDRLRKSLEMPETVAETQKLLKSHANVVPKYQKIFDSEDSVRNLVKGLSRYAIHTSNNDLSELEARLQNKFLGFLDSYKNLIRPYSKSLPFITSNPPLLELPSETGLLEGVTVKDKTRQENLCERELILGETAHTLHSLLTLLDVRLVKLWQGALESYNSRNPDRPRHIAVSLRELLMHVVHYLAPDISVRAWSNSPEHYSNRRPTREARLLFICRDINHGPFCKFVKREISAILEFVDLCHGGTHKLESSYDEKQLSVLIHQMETIIRFLIVTCRPGKS